MSAQVHLRAGHVPNQCILLPSTSLQHTFCVLNSSRENRVVLGLGRSFLGLNERILENRRRTAIIKRKTGPLAIRASAGGAVWDGWLPDKTSKAPPLSDIFWPSAGAFAAMAMLGKIDQILAPKGISMTIAPLGAVCAVLFATPSTPGARKYNMFMAQIGCAAIGVLAFTILGPGWLARSAALSAAMAFMIYTRSVHPPAASLPLLFIDGVKLHHLNYWYALFPGAAGCILLCLIKGDRVLCKDCKVIPSEHLSTQHRLLVMDLFIKKSKKSRAGEGRPRIKWGGLTPVSALEIGEKVAGMGCGSVGGTWMLCGTRRPAASGRRYGLRTFYPL